MERIQNHEVPQGLMDSMLQLGTYLKSTGLESSLLALLKARISQINGCAYCLDMYYKQALHAGESEKRLSLLATWRETPFFTPKERAVLAFGEKLTLLAFKELPDNLHDELKQFFSVADIANLTFAVGQINAWNRIVRSFGTPAGNYKIS